jgi:hypothetical protein
MFILNSGQKKLQKHIQENFNVEDAISFARSHPKLTYEQLSKSVDINIASVQLIWLIADEAMQTKQVDWFVKDALVREMQAECPHGWHYDQNANYETAGAIAYWISTIGYLGQQVVDISNIACERLRLAAPEGWLPSSIDDPVIGTTFEGLSFNLKATQTAQG